jgi:predicted nucleic acid-binding protein
MKVILDANLLVSAYTCDGVVRRHYLHDLELVETFISPEIFIEVERSLRRKEFGVEPSDVAVILKGIIARCKVIRIKAKPDSGSGDDSDWHVRALALQIGADCVLTGDKGLAEDAAAQGIVCKRITDFVSEQKVSLNKL